MAGRMGGQTVTVKNLKVVDVDKDHNALLVKGAVPGKPNSLVKIEIVEPASARFKKKAE
jgi:large subunit ribosomal protein L3